MLINELKNVSRSFIQFILFSCLQVTTIQNIKKNANIKHLFKRNYLFMFLKVNIFFHMLDGPGKYVVLASYITLGSESDGQKSQNFV